MKARETAFTYGQRELLTQVLDRIVPSDGGLLGAGELGAQLVQLADGIF